MKIHDLPWVMSGLTFWPRFYGVRNTLRNRVEKKDLGACGTDMCIEFRCGSCWGSQISWRGHIRILFARMHKNTFQDTHQRILHVQKSTWYRLRDSIWDKTEATWYRLRDSIWDIEKATWCRLRDSHAKIPSHLPIPQKGHHDSRFTSTISNLAHASHSISGFPGNSRIDSMSETPYSISTFPGSSEIDFKNIVWTCFCRLSLPRYWLRVPAEGFHRRYSEGDIVPP